MPLRARKWENPLDPDNDFLNYSDLKNIANQVLVLQKPRTNASTDNITIAGGQSGEILRSDSITSNTEASKMFISFRTGISSSAHVIAGYTIQVSNDSGLSWSSVEDVNDNGGLVAAKYHTAAVGQVSDVEFTPTVNNTYLFRVVGKSSTYMSENRTFNSTTCITTGVTGWIDVKEEQ